MNSSRHFPNNQQMFFELWKQIGKTVFLSALINFFKRKFFPEKNSVREFSSELGWSFDRVLRRKKTFSGKLSAELSERDSTLSEGRFVFFCFFFWHIYEKCVPVSRWNFWGKFLLTNKCLRILLKTWVDICRTLTTTLLPIVKKSFYLSRAVFPGDFLTWNLIKQLKNLFRKSSRLFS